MRVTMFGAVSAALWLSCTLLGETSVATSGSDQLGNENSAQAGFDPTPLVLAGELRPEEFERLDSWKTLDPLSLEAARLRARCGKLIRAIEQAVGRKVGNRTGSREGGKAVGDDDLAVAWRLQAIYGATLLEARARFVAGDHEGAVRLVGACLAFSRHVVGAHGYSVAPVCALAHRDAAELVAEWLPTMDESELNLTLQVFGQLGPTLDAIALLRREAARLRPKLREELADFFRAVAKEEAKYHRVRKETIDKVWKLFGFDEVSPELLEKAHAEWVADLERVMRSGPPRTWEELEQAARKRVIRAWRAELEPFFPELFRKGWVNRDVDGLYYYPYVLIARILRRVEAYPRLASMKPRRPLAILVARLNPLISAFELAPFLDVTEGYPVLVRAAAQRIAGREPEALRELERLGLTAIVEPTEDGFTIRTRDRRAGMKLVVRKSRPSP